MTTCKPETVGELQLYKVLQRANLLQYYDTFISQGGDDVAQLCEAGEEEFLEIMSLVDMASKPLHVRRLQKALQEWVTKPKLFKNISLNYRPVQSRPLSAFNPHVHKDGAGDREYNMQENVFARVPSVSPNRPHSSNSNITAQRGERMVIMTEWKNYKQNQRSVKNGVSRKKIFKNSSPSPAVHINKNFPLTDDTLHGLTSSKTFPTPTSRNDVISPNIQESPLEFDMTAQVTPDEVNSVANRLQVYGEHSLALALQLNEKDSIKRETKKYVGMLYQKFRSQFPDANVRAFAYHLALDDCRYFFKPEELFSFANKLSKTVVDSDKLNNEDDFYIFINQQKSSDIEKRLKIINVQREAFERKVIMATNPAHANEYQTELSRLTQEKFSLLQKKSELQRNYAAVVSSNMQQDFSSNDSVNNETNKTEEALDLHIPSKLNASAEMESILENSNRDENEKSLFVKQEFVHGPNDIYPSETQGGPPLKRRGDDEPQDSTFTKQLKMD